MKHNKLRLVALAACLITASAGFAAKGGRVGGATTPAVITFRDCTAGFPSAAFAGLHPGTPLLDLCAPVLEDRIKSDTGIPYEDGVQGVEAFIGSTGNDGNVWLKLKNSPRGLFLDFTDCASPGQCNPPFTTPRAVDLANIKVDANDVKQNGLFGMALEETINPPMRVYYWLAADQEPGFVDFNPNQTGKSPCKNKGSLVTVTRTGAATWEIIGDPNIIGCVTLPGGGFGGTYRMPFQFTVQVK